MPRQMTKWQGSQELQDAFLDHAGFDLKDIANTWRLSIAKLTELMDHPEPKIAMESAKRLSFLLLEATKMAKLSEGKGSQEIIVRANPFIDQNEDNK